MSEVLNQENSELKASNERLTKVNELLTDKFNELSSAMRSVNRGKAHEVTSPDDDEPCYLQRKKWTNWMIELADEADELTGQKPSNHIND